MHIHICKHTTHTHTHTHIFPGGSLVKNLPANAGDTVLIHGSGNFPGEGNGNLLQYSCLKKIPWMEEPGRLQSMWSYRVGHDLATEHMYSIYIYIYMHQENVILSLWRTLLLIQSEVLLQDRDTLGKQTQDFADFCKEKCTHHLKKN